MKYVSAAFSLNMLPPNKAVRVFVLPVSLEAARAYIQDPQVVSAVGHADTAAVLTTLLDSQVVCARTTIHLTPHQDSLLVAQYLGPRLPEGATTLPPGSSIDFLYVVIDEEV